MAFIATIPPGKATGEAAEVYRYMRQVGGAGLIAKIVQLFSLRAGSMRRMIRSWELAMWMAPEPRATRELVAAMVSRFNNCHY